jgi:hypothetical protein
MSETPDERIARFRLVQTPNGDKVRIYCTFRGIALTLLWVRADDDSDRDDVDDLIEALPAIWAKCVTELNLQAEFAGLDTEIEDLLKGGNDE